MTPGRSSTKYLSLRATSARDRITRMHFSRAIEKANTSPERNLLKFPTNRNKLERRGTRIVLILTRKQWKNCYARIGKKYYYRILIGIDTIIKRGKLTNKKETNLVHKINCKDFNASYIGQTKRHLETRLKEHQKQSSVVQ